MSEIFSQIVHVEIEDGEMYDYPLVIEKAVEPLRCILSLKDDARLCFYFEKTLYELDYCKLLDEPIEAEDGIWVDNMDPFPEFASELDEMLTELKSDSRMRVTLTVTNNSAKMTIAEKGRYRKLSPLLTITMGLSDGSSELAHYR